MTEFLIILFLLFIACIAAYYSRTLSLSGAVAAFITGAAIEAGFGLPGLVLLLLFFVTSSYWSKYKSSKKKFLEDKVEKGSTRDWQQVAANGGGAMLFSVLNLISPNELWALGFTICLASANSDTWASEIGTLSKKNPIFIRTLKPVERGTSGAVSDLGTAAAIAGSLTIAAASFYSFHLSMQSFLYIFLFGFLGNIIDSLIGAYYQQLYHCPHCGVETEKRVHCGMKTTKVKGIPLIDNDMVNFLSGFIAALLAIALVGLTN